MGKKTLRFNPCPLFHHTPFCLTVESRNCLNTERTNQPKKPFIFPQARLLSLSSPQALHLPSDPPSSSQFPHTTHTREALPALPASSFNHFPFPQCLRSPDDFLLASKRHLNLFSQRIQHNKLPGIKLAIKGPNRVFPSGAKLVIANFIWKGGGLKMCPSSRF